MKKSKNVKSLKSKNESLWVWIILLIVVGIFTSFLIVGFSGNSFENETSPKSSESTPVENVQTGYYELDYEWDYDGFTWTWRGNIPKETYNYFSDKKRTADFSKYVKSTKDDEPIKELAQKFENIRQERGWKSFKTVSLALSFVQSLPHTSDKVVTGYDEYPRYPIETLVDKGGDCEDTSILFAAIVQAMGYESILLKLEKDNHIATGVLISEELMNNWNQSYPLTYYEVDNDFYAYCEADGKGWEIGHKPDNLKTKSPNIIVI